MKPCVICGTPIERRSGESTRNYDRRQACSQACRYRIVGNKLRRPKPPARSLSEAIKQSWETRKLETAPRVAAKRAPKRCEACDEEFGPRSGETTANYQRRRACSPPCKRHLQAAAHHRLNKRVDLGEKACPICGVLFRRRSDQSLKDFRKQRTCSKECGTERRALTLMTTDRTSPYPPEWTHRFRAAIRERDNHLCQWCGTTRGRLQLPVHHIDYNKANLDPSNLITLCHSCHSKTNYNRERWPARLSPLITRGAYL